MFLKPIDLNPKTGGLTGPLTGGSTNKPPVPHRQYLCGFQKKTGGWEVYTLLKKLWCFA